MNYPTSAEEARDEFLNHLAKVAKYWARLPDLTPQERCDGVVFSILNMFDGTSLAWFMGKMDIVIDGEVVNDGIELHSIWSKYNPE
jgi:hypothetical protein